jgi:hypothetical protein
MATPSSGDSVMSAIDFVNQLHETGHLTVRLDSAPLEDLRVAVEALDSAARLNLAFEAPALDVEAAGWALTQLYRACQFLSYRHIETATVDTVLAMPCPKPASPEVCYSVDLAFRFLPDLIALAAGISHDDPLVINLRRLATEWPLSSVGVKDIENADVNMFFDNASLASLYVDRIIERKDTSRLNDPRVKERVQAALGAYPDLSPQLASVMAAPIEST